MIDVYRKFYERATNEGKLYVEPISLKEMMEAGMSDKDVVIYLRFVDLFRSAIIIKNEVLLSGKQDDNELRKTIDKYGERLTERYIRFISNLIGYDIQLKEKFFNVISCGTFLITYNNGEGIVTRKWLNCMFLSFEDFRARLEGYTAIIVFNKRIRCLESEDEYYNKLSRIEIENKIRTKEKYIDDNIFGADYPDLDISMCSKYDEIVEIAKELSEAQEHDSRVDDSRRELEKLNEELNKRINNAKNEINNDDVVHEIKVPWKKIENHEKKCLYPSCTNKNYREGFCWYHYQEEKYLSKQ